MAAGNFTFTVVASDRPVNGETDSETVTLAVLENMPPQFARLFQESDLSGCCRSCSFRHSAFQAEAWTGKILL